MEGSLPARPAEPGTLKASLMKLPRIESLTEGVSAHPSQKQLDRLTQALDSTSLDSGKSLASEGSPVQPGVELNRSEASNEDTSNAMEEKETAVKRSESTCTVEEWAPTPEWVSSWKNQLPLQTVMRMLQVSLEI